MGRSLNSVRVDGAVLAEISSCIQCHRNAKRSRLMQDRQVGRFALTGIFLIRSAPLPMNTFRTLSRLSVVLTAASMASLLASCNSAPKRWAYRYRPERTASLRDGKAVPPAGLPSEVNRALSAGNQIVGMPYKFGGGHRQIEDSGYDCSGTVSYTLLAAGLLNQPTNSQGFRKFGSGGQGKHITIYAGKGHVFAEIAGLRLDTGFGEGSTQGPQWSTRSRPASGYEMRHPPGL